MFADKNTIIAVAGPTAVGKTKFAIMLAQNFNGDFHNAVFNRRLCHIPGYKFLCSTHIYRYCF